jgi:hypothetical protein
MTNETSRATLELDTGPPEAHFKRRRVLMRQRGLSVFVAIGLFALAAAGCDDQQPKGPSVFGVGPSVATDLVATVQPAFVPLTPTFVTGCPISQPFVSAFDLVITSRSPSTLNLDRVTFSFLDGSSVSSQPIVFTRPQLTRLFPTVSILGRTSGTFPFRPQFGCGIGIPQTLVVDLLLLDAFNGQHPIMTRVGMR